MKNHIRVDGKLLQTNKKYAQLKLKQKERIHGWMYTAYRKQYIRNGKSPEGEDDEEILEYVMEKIENADIWIPEKEVRKHYFSIKNNLKKRLNREKIKERSEKLELMVLPEEFSVCKVSDFSEVNIDRPYCFIGNTDEEKSLICPLDIVPGNIMDRDDGWRCFRIRGELEFSLIGILSSILKVLASNEIGILAVSTYNTDYVFTKTENFQKALTALKNAGYQVLL